MGHQSLVLDFSERRADGSFLVSVKQATGREKSGSFTTPFTAEAFEQAYAKSEDLRSLRTQFGKALYDALFHDQVEEALGLALDNLPQGERLHIVLSFMAKYAEHSALSGLPWELLYRGRDEFHLAMQDDILITRHLEVDQRTRDPKTVRRLSVLGVIANPTDPGVTSFDGQGFRDHLKSSLGRYQLDILEQPTLEALKLQLKKKPYDILHFTGHGGQVKGEWGMCFEDEQGRLDFVKAKDLRQLFNSFDSLRLINLVSCHLAQGLTQRDELAGVAHCLVTAGATAVAAMQFPIGFDEAMTYTQNFYQGLNEDFSLEEAIQQARSVLYMRNRDGLAFATPVLFLRSGAGPLWQQPPQRKYCINSIYCDPVNRLQPAELEGSRLVDLSRYFVSENNETTERIAIPNGWSEMDRRLSALVMDGDSDEVVTFCGRAYLSIWFALGYKFRSPAAVDVAVLKHSQARKENELWRPNRNTPPLPLQDPVWEGPFNGGELVVMINVTRENMQQAVTYCKGQPELSALTRVYLSVPNPSQEVIENEAMAQGYTNAFVKQLRQLPGPTRIHMFMAVPNGMAFLIARELSVTGAIVFYDFTNGSYEKTFTLR